MCDLYKGEEAEDGLRFGMSELVDELVVAATNIRIYWNKHPRVKASVRTLTEGLGQLFGGGNQELLILGVAEGCLFFEQKPLVGASVSAPRIVRRLVELGTGGICFTRQVEERDFEALVELLGHTQGEERNLQEANKELERHGCFAIRFMPPYRAEGFGPGLGEPTQFRDGAIPAGPTLERPELALELEAPISLYRDTVELLQESVVQASHGSALDVDQAKGVVRSIFRQLRDDAPSMRGITRYERYDAYTFGHSIRVCTLALSFARELITDEGLVMRVGLAGLLHDIGKAWVPFEVLHSTSRLNPEERLEMNKHAEHGARILLTMPNVDPLLVAAAFGHHRTQDGGGYPEMVCRVPQSVGTRIVKICDVYEALTAVRPYKASMTPMRAYQVMMAMKDHFDPGLLRRFITTNGIYPVGSDVLLSEGVSARVIRQGTDFEHPVVRLLDDSGNFTREEAIDLQRHSLRIEAALPVGGEAAKAA